MLKVFTVQVLNHQHLTVTLILSVFGINWTDAQWEGLFRFPPQAQILPLEFLIIVISGSRDWGVEEGVTEEALYTGVDPEVGAGGGRLGTGAQRLGSRWPGAGLCLEVACTWGGWWRPGEEWTAEGGALKWAKGASWRGCCRRLTDGAGSCGAKCRRAWRDGCRWDSEEQGRTCFGWSLCTCPEIQKRLGQRAERSEVAAEARFADELNRAMQDVKKSEGKKLHFTPM